MLVADSKPQDLDRSANCIKRTGFLFTPINKIHKVVPKQFNLQVTCYVSKNGHGERHPSDKWKLIAMCSRSPQNLECGHFTLWFAGDAKEMYHSVITHVQSQYFVIKTCFLAFCCRRRRRCCSRLEVRINSRNSHTWQTIAFQCRRYSVGLVTHSSTNCVTG